MMATRLMATLNRTQSWRNRPQVLPRAQTSPVAREAKLKGTRTIPPVKLHHQIGPLDRLRVLAGQAGDAEGEEGNDGAEPADRGGDGGGDAELAESRGK